MCVGRTPCKGPVPTPQPLSGGSQLLQDPSRVWGFHLNVEVEEESQGRSGDWPSVHRTGVSTPPLQVGEAKVTICAQGTRRGSLKCHGGHVHDVLFTYSSGNSPAGQWAVEGAVESA